MLTTFKGHGEPLARLHYDFSHPLILRPAFYGTPTLAGASTQHQRTIAYCPRQKTHRTDYFVVRSRLLRRSFGHGPIASRLFTPTDFPARILWHSDFGRCAHKPRPQPRHQTAKPNQDATPIHNIKPQTFTTPGRKTHNRNQFIAMSGKIRTFA